MSQMELLHFKKHKPRTVFSMCTESTHTHTHTVLRVDRGEGMQEKSDVRKNKHTE